MAKNDERLIFGVGFDIATGIDEIIKQWEGKESKRLQKALDKRPLKVSLEIKKGVLTELKDFISMTKQLSSAQKALNNVKKQELDIESKQARVKQRRATARAAESRAAVQEATQQDQINKKKADAAYAEERLANAKRNGTAATNAQNTAYQTQSGYLQRLVTRMAAYFSIHQALNFLRQIREVTAEFELQRISLGALIQDAYKANTIFEQIKVQAVKSPYEIKDLVTYTKRLAAYGVEADDLMDTMNRLADISAGLGADMDRIILAYGQIQAAGVLKGTELRQLTELGIPMVDLLAQYYSTLRNEVVTTADVFDMISKKEIPFEAVKDVLTDLTDEGGRFFDMQSKQAETLAGQWSNMKDTLSIMFDEIGRTDEVRSMLNAWIESVKWLALNWQSVWKSVKMVGVAYLGLKAGASIIRLLSFETVNYAAASRRAKNAQATWNAMTFKANGLAVINAKRMQIATWAMRKYTLATNVATKAMYKLTAAMMSNPIGWILGLIGVVASLALAFRKSKDAMDSFRESQREAVKEAVENTTLMVANFKRLANEAINSADGSERQNQALRKLKQQYGEMFPEYKLTIEYLRSMTDETGKLTGAFTDMESTIRSFSAERMRQSLIENYQKQLENLFSDTYSKLTDEYGTNFSELIGQIMSWAFEEGITEAELQKKVFYAFLKATNQSWEDFGDKAIKAEAGENVKDAYSRLMNEDYSDFSELGTRGQADAYMLLIKLAEALRESNGEIEDMMESFDNLDPQMKAVNSRISQFNTELEEIRKNTGGETTENVENAIKQAENEAINQVLEDLLAMELATVNVELPPNFIINLDNIYDAIKAIENLGFEFSDAFYSGLRSVHTIAGDYDDLWREDMANMVAYLDNGTRKVQAYASDQISQFSQLWDALPEVAKRYKELDEQLEQLKKTYDALTNKPIDEQDVQEIEKYRKELSKVETIMQFLYSFLEKYGGLDLLKDKDGTKKKVNPDIKKLEDEYAMVEKIYKKYEEFRKIMGDEQARIEVEKYFEGVDLQWLDKAFSSDELKSQAQDALRILKTFWGDTKKAQQNLQFKIGDIDFDDTKRELEDRLKKLSDQISRTKTAKEFFDRMLGMTGDRELSATLTLSVYGTTGDDLKTLMTRQVEEAFENVDISSARLGDGKFDYNILAGLIEHLPEEQQKNAQSIVDNWRKANADILNDVITSYEDFMTYEERKTQVAEKYAAERKKIMESELPEAEKDKYVKATNKHEGKELADIAIEEFKASDDWAKSFEELENLATPTIERLMQSLREFIDTQDDLSPEQLKTLTNEYQKLYDGLIARNPFKAITDSVKEYRLAIANIRDVKNQLDFAKDLGDEELVANIERDLTDALDNAQKAITKLKKGVDGVGDKFSQAASDVEFFAKALGLSEDSHVSQFLTAMANAFKGVSIAIGVADLAMKLFDGTIKSFLASNPIGWILLIVSAIISAVQAIMNARLNRINDEIEALQDKLDNLEYAYERLSQAAERAFGTEYIQNYERQIDNLNAQLEAYEKQLSLERSKGKKADEEKIKEYEDKVRDTTDAIKDMYGTLSEHFLGQDLASAARDFASAWIDAYKSFSNTTDAMRDKFEEMIQNMIVESLLAKVMERALEPVFKMVDNMVDSDFYSNSFWAQLSSEMEKATENGAIGAENIMSMFESMGINLRDTGASLTGISKDIATASEESILGLAAGINTQNFYISQVPTKLDTIIGLLRGGSQVVQGGVNMQDLITIQNQHLSYLPTIAQHTSETVAECKAIVVETRRTADALERVVKPRGTQSTHSVNVTIGS